MRRLEQLKPSFVKADMSVVGTKRPKSRVRCLVAFGVKADIEQGTLSKLAL
jgi:hypothetical protein